MLRIAFASFRCTIGWTLSLLIQAVCVGCVASASMAQQPPKIEFNLLELPTCRQVLSKLSSPAVATFDKQPMGECLKNLSDFYNVAIWVDRKVDRSQLVSIVGLASKESPEANTTLGRIRAVAKLGNADAGLIENIVYVGPADKVAAVQFAAIRLHNEIMLARKKSGTNARFDSKPLSWDELATPSDLLDSIRRDWSIELDAELPHDLMHAGKLPPSTLATQLTVLFAGFDQQVECESGSHYSVAKLANETSWKSDYSAKEIQTANYSAAKRDYPSASMLVRNGTCTITGPTAFHLRLLTARATVTRNLEPKFTLADVRGPVEQIVAGLAKHLNLQVSWSDAVPLSKKQSIITFGVKVAKTPDEIIAQLAKDSGLSIQRNGETISVSPDAN